jgi:hypothetical protein
MISQGNTSTWNITSATWFNNFFLDSQDEENVFACPFVTLKYRFIDFYIVAFYDVQKEDYWVLKAILLLETSLPRLLPSRFFGCPDGGQWVLMAFRHIETTLNRHYQNRILRRPEGIWVLRVIHLLKKSLPRLRPSRFVGCPGCR